MAAFRWVTALCFPVAIQQTGTAAEAVGTSVGSSDVGNSSTAGKSISQLQRWRSFGSATACHEDPLTATNGIAVPAKQMRVDSVEECKVLCANTADGMCRGVEYDNGNGSCSLFRNPVNRARLAEGRECWSYSVSGQEHDGSEVFVMMPLDVVNNEGDIAYPVELSQLLDGIKIAGIDGITVDVWWGLTERSPKVYDFRAYREIFNLVKEREWKVHVICSFHQCGGNVGDKCNIMLPSFVRDSEGIWYVDSEGNEDREYISLFADEVQVGDRSPLQMYQDWMTAFSDEFSGDMGVLIEEVAIGMGPCGELRYPSYRLSHWKFCGLGEFQCYDMHALAQLRIAAERVGQPSWGIPPTQLDAGNYNSRPSETDFFTKGFRTDRGRFFLEWYSGRLKEHGRRLLATARALFPHSVRLSGKIAGIHWWYSTDSHAAEVTAGYYNTNFRNAYAEIASVFQESGSTICFTCLEMRNAEQPEECRSSPEGLVDQVIQATSAFHVPLSGENALARYDQWAYDKLVSYREHVSVLTYLRLGWELLKPENIQHFRRFTWVMHGNSPASLPVMDMPEFRSDSQRDIILP